jgi:hypothetical protein
MGHDCAFLGEAFDMVGLFRQERLRDKQWEVGVNVPGGLESCIEVGLDGLPNAVAMGFDDHAAPDWGLIDQFTGSDHIQVPL